MNLLLEKFEEYKSIVNYRFVYQFANGLSIEYKLRQADFPHYGTKNVAKHAKEIGITYRCSVKRVR